MIGVLETQFVWPVKFCIKDCDRKDGYKVLNLRKTILTNGTCKIVLEELYW